MDFRYLIIQSIALMYWESLLPDAGFNSKPLIRELLLQLPNPDSLAGSDDDRENLLALRDICGSMLISKESMSKDFLASKLRLSIKKDQELRDDVNEALSGSTDDEKQIQERIIALQGEINHYFTQKKFKDEIKKIAGQTIFNGASNFNVADMARDIISKLDYYTTASFNDNEDPNMVGEADTGDIESVVKLFTQVQEDLDPESTIKTGWQAFNRMCGEVGGLRRGNMYLVGARPSNGKSLISSCLTLHTMIHNKPFLFDETKKPAVVHFSMENDLLLNLKIWTRYLWENDKNEVCNIQEMSPRFLAEWFIERVERNGHKFMWKHFNPTSMGYEDIFNSLRKVEAEGYEIQLCTIDYLAMVSNAGLKEENQAFWIRQLFKVVRNYTSSRKITTIIPHQVAPDAANLLRAGTDDFVKQIAGKRYWAGCKSIDMEVDMEIVLNIEHTGQGDDRQAYMAFGRGKDRATQGTPEQDCFFFIPFSKVGGLRWDIHTTDSSKRALKGAGSISVNDDWMMSAESEQAVTSLG